MIFASPGLFWLLVFTPAIGLLLVWAGRRRRDTIARVFSAEAYAALVSPGLGRARSVQAVTAVVAVLMISLAAARPQLGHQWVQRRGKGVDIVVVLDVSRSMDAEDVSPSRMERARREVIDFVGLLRGDRVGLVLVANGAYLRTPLTTDYGTFVWALADSSTTTIAAQGTAMAQGLDTATQMLTRGGGAGKAVLIVSDGEFHDPPEALAAAAARAKEAGALVYGLGVGDAGGAPIPLPEGGFKKDRSGAIVLSRLEPGGLRALAAATGGAYVEAVAGSDDVAGLYEGEIRARLEAKERDLHREKIPNEVYQWPLAAGLLALAALAFFGIGPRARRTGAAAAFVLVALLAAPGPALAGPREEGLAAWRAKDWSTAAEQLGQARVQDVRDIEVGQALAESLYRKGRFREAEQLYLSLAENDPEHAGTHRYNAGNSAYADGRLERALNLYDTVRTAAPEIKSAAKNFEAVKKEVALREQQPPPDGDPGQGEGDSGEQGQPSDEGQPGADGQPGQQGEPEAGSEPGDGGVLEAQSGEEPPQGSPAGDPSGAPDTGEGAPAAVDAPESSSGELSAEAAARLVDSVVDGRPRVRVAGRETEKDW
ncbi:MAG: VWA domain-containing protein [Myxococcales bacterium]|nr:VWA domain-containing protein [Myxococcales bacterium]